MRREHHLNLPKREERKNPTNEMIRKSAEEGKELLESSGGGHSQEQKFQTTSSGRGGMRESDKQLRTAMECPNGNYILPYLSKLELEMWGWTIRRTLCPRF